MFRTMCLIREFDTQVRTLWMKNDLRAGAFLCRSGSDCSGGVREPQQEDFYYVHAQGAWAHHRKGGDVRAMMAELHGKYEGLNRGRRLDAHRGR